MLSKQLADLLEIFVEHAPDLATHDEIEKKLWPSTDFAEFDVAIRAATKKLRDALGESAQEPKYIETIPRRGYRLMVPVEWVGAPPTEDEPGTQESWRERVLGSVHRRSAFQRILLYSAPVVLLAFAYGLSSGAFYLARFYNNHGVMRHAHGPTKEGMRHYERAIRNSPGYACLL